MAKAYNPDLKDDNAGPGSLNVSTSNRPLASQAQHYCERLEKHGLNNHKEASDLTEAVKQSLYEDYLIAYSESNR